MHMTVHDEKNTKIPDFFNSWTFVRGQLTRGIPQFSSKSNNVSFQVETEYAQN